jgi:hypothetical protein
MKQSDVVISIIDYEAGELDDKGTIELFSHLIKDGSAWSLQGAYGRTASALIEKKLISREGKINKAKLRKLGVDI